MKSKKKEQNRKLINVKYTFNVEMFSTNHTFKNRDFASRILSAEALILVLAGNIF